MNPGITSKYSTTSTLFAGLAKNILCFRWLLLLLVAGLTIFAFSEMRNLRFDNSNEVWFVEGDPTVELIDKFRDIFGNDDFVILLFESDTFFDSENIRLLGNLAKALEAEVPYLKDMIWLGNVEYIEGVRDGINIYELLETIPETPEEMALIRAKALDESTYLNSLIAPDGQAYTIILEMEKYPEDGGHAGPEKRDRPGGSANPGQAGVCRAQCARCGRAGPAP